MDSSTVEVETIQQIELCESHLVCGMFEEAANLASSILDNGVKNGYEQHNLVMHDTMESAAMVLVQSLGELGRASEILNLLRHYFGSVKSIPVQVLLAGACIQVSRSDTTASIEEFLKDFLANWQLGDQGYFLDQPADSSNDYQNYVLGVDEYLEVAEFYALAVLGTVKKDLDSSISWVESAPLSEEARQELLRRIQSLCEATSLPLITSGSLQANESEILHSHEGKTDSSDKSQSLSMTINVREPGQDKSALRWPGKMRQYFYWLQSNMIGNSGAFSSNMKILIGCFVFVICYILRRRRRFDVMSYVKVKASTVKKALLDFWLLAFSYQVNPLAAVQSLPSTNSRS